MNIIIRYSEPSQYDQADYGSYCKVNTVNGYYHLYRQISKDEDPKWEHLGFFHELDEIPFE